MSTRSILMFTVLIGFVAVSTCYGFKKRDYSTWAVAIATVTRIWELDGTDVTYEYWVKGMKYTNSGPSPEGTTYGDMYLILYNPQSPSESRMNTSTPFFYDDEQVEYTSGEIVAQRPISASTYKDKQYYLFWYKYYVNGEKYEREQDFTFCGSPPLVLKNGMKFQVKYSPNNSHRALLMVEKVPRYTIRDIPCELQGSLAIPQRRQ